jgi:Zn-dependent M28 family amino/carboxypeptidase
MSPESASPETTAEARLRFHVDYLAGEIGERNIFEPQALAASHAYLDEEWRRQGYDVACQWYDVENVRCANLEVTRIGSVVPEHILLIGAHYDSVWGSPGANDNGSGVAALLEISRRFAKLSPPMTVRFVAFVNEEPPFFTTGQQGSMVYARAARDRGDDIRLMVSLETIGCYREERGSQHYPPLFGFFYPDRANFIAFASDLGSRRVMRRAVKAFQDSSQFPIESAATFRFVPGVAWSDHLSFWKNRYRAFMVTDTAFYRYPHYHTAQDTPEKIAYGELAQVTEGLSGMFVALTEEL